MTARCDLSDLPVDQCACRLHGPQETARLDVELVGQPFPARYPGECAACGGRIDEGDPICGARDGGTRLGYAHAGGCPTA